MAQHHGGRTDDETAVADGTTSDQRQLLQRVEQGDDTAFWELWQHFEDDVCFRQCYHLMRRHRQDAEDALSSGRLKAHQQLPVHASKIEHINGWLSRLLYNHCIDIRRARERHDRAVCCVGDVDMMLGKVLPVTHESAEDVVLRHEAMLYIHHVIDNLPRRLREPCQLRFFYDMPSRDIAAYLRLSPANVRKRLQQARTLLRERITAYLSGCSPEAWEPVIVWRYPAEPIPEPDDLQAACAARLIQHEMADVDESTMPGHTMTTLYDLIVMLHDVFLPEEDDLIVATVIHWLDTGWLRLPHSLCSQVDYADVSANTTA